MTFSRQLKVCIIRVNTSQNPARLANLKPKARTLWRRAGGQCAVHGRHCEPFPVEQELVRHVAGLVAWLAQEVPCAWQVVAAQEVLDLYVAGFVCKLFSQESTTRYDSGDVESLFQLEGPLAACKQCAWDVACKPHEWRRAATFSFTACLIRRRELCPSWRHHGSSSVTSRGILAVT